MVKKQARAKIEEVLKESKGQWLCAEEVMYRVNQRMPSRSSVMVGTVVHYMRVLRGRGVVEIKSSHRASEYRLRQ